MALFINTKSVPPKLEDCGLDVEDQILSRSHRFSQIVQEDVEHPTLFERACIIAYALDQQRPQTSLW